MGYTAIDLLQVLGATSASAHLVVASGPEERIELWVRDGKIINLSGCSAQDLVTRLSSPSPSLLIEPMTQNPEAAMAFDISVLSAQHSGLPGGPPTMPLPTRNLAPPPPVPPEHPEAKKISSSLKRQTIDTAAHTEQADLPPERTYRRLVFPARQALTITLGRSPDCDVTCLNPTVSRKHCMLVFDGVLFTIHDLGSRNGTFLNKERVITGRAGRKALLSLGTDHYLLDWED